MKGDNLEALRLVAQAVGARHCDCVLEDKPTDAATVRAYHRLAHTFGPHEVVCSSGNGALDLWAASVNGEEPVLLLPDISHRAAVLILCDDYLALKLAYTCSRSVSRLAQ